VLLTAEVGAITVESEVVVLELLLLESGLVGLTLGLEIYPG
jgi:hypothetical protein